MTIVEKLTGYPSSRLTNARKLIIGSCIMILAPVLSLPTIF